jgi:hypothetical protein
MEHFNKIADNLRQLLGEKSNNEQVANVPDIAPRLGKGEKKSVRDDCILIAFYAYGHDYEAVFYKDGLGLLYDDTRHPNGEADAGFSHELNLTKLAQTMPGNALRDYLEGYFWREVNPNLEHPLVKDQNDLEKYELEFVAGSQEEFERLINLFILTEPEDDMLNSGEDEIRIICGSREHEDVDDPEPHLTWGYRSERMDKLINLALKEHYPRGYRYEWSDGPADRLWGYSLRVDELKYELNYFPPAREKMAARAELRHWLTERGYNPSDYGLDWEQVDTDLDKPLQAVGEDKSIAISETSVIIGFEANSMAYRATFRADGTGSLYDVHRSKEGEADYEFTHNLLFTDLVRDAEPAALQQQLEEYFWREINPNIPNWLVRSEDDLEHYELEFVLGNQAEFERLMRLFILTEPVDRQKNSRGEVIVACASKALDEDDNPEPHLERWSYQSERLNALLKLVVKEHYPRGYRFQWNDGAVDRIWGYAVYADYLTFNIDEILQAPAREKMQARQELSNWLKERGENPADYGLFWEKIL